LALAGGLAVLKNMHKVDELVAYYKANARLILKTFQDIGFTTYGGKDSPYVFVQFPGKGSWEAFDDVLDKVQVITTPGVGFGASGEGFIRVSSYGTKENVEEACRRFKAQYGK